MKKDNKLNAYERISNCLWRSASSKLVASSRLQSTKILQRSKFYYLFKIYGTRYMAPQYFTIGSTETLVFVYRLLNYLFSCRLLYYLYSSHYQSAAFHYTGVSIICYDKVCCVLKFIMHLISRSPNLRLRVAWALSYYLYNNDSKKKNCRQVQCIYACIKQEMTSQLIHYNKHNNNNIVSTVTVTKYIIPQAPLSWHTPCPHLACMRRLMFTSCLHASLNVHILLACRLIRLRACRRVSSSCIHLSLCNYSMYLIKKSSLFCVYH